MQHWPRHKYTPPDPPKIQPTTAETRRGLSSGRLHRLAMRARSSRAVATATSAESRRRTRADKNALLSVFGYEKGQGWALYNSQGTDNDLAPHPTGESFSVLEVSSMSARLWTFAGGARVSANVSVAVDGRTQDESATAAMATQRPSCCDDRWGA